MAYTNFFATKLSAGISASDDTIALDLAPLDKDGNPITSGRLVIQANSPNFREIISFSGASGSTLTGVVRGQGGTQAVPHVQGSIVEMNLTAEDIIDALNVPNDIKDRWDYSFPDYIVEGTGLVSSVSGLEGSIGDIDAYIDGVLVQATNISNKTFTASKDTYCRIDNSGDIAYDEQTIDTNPPSTPSHEIYFAKVRTDGSGITSIIQLNQGIKGTLANQVISVNGSNEIVPSTKVYTASAIAANFTLKPPSIPAVDGAVCIIRLKDSGSTRTITLDSGYSNVSGVVFPTATVAGKWLTVGVLYNSVTSKWEIQGINKET